MSKTKPKKTVTKPKVSADEQHYQRWLENLKSGDGVSAMRFTPGYGAAVLDGIVKGVDASAQFVFVKFNGRDGCESFSRLDGYQSRDASSLRLYAMNHPMVTEPKARKHFEKVVDWARGAASYLDVDMIREILAVVDKYEAKKGSK